MEIYYLYLEFFPVVLEPRYTIDDGTELLIFHRFFRIYSSSANIAKYSYSTKIADNLLIGEFYKKWKIIRSKEKAVFNLFCFTARCEDYIFETPAAAIIQYIEEYFRCHHGDILEKYGLKCSTTPGYVYWIPETSRYNYLSARLHRCIVRGSK